MIPLEPTSKRSFDGDGRSERVVVLSFCVRIRVRGDSAHTPSTSLWSALHPRPPSARTILAFLAGRFLNMEWAEVGRGFQPSTIRVGNIPFILP